MLLVKNGKGKAVLLPNYEFGELTRLEKYGWEFIRLVDVPPEIMRVRVRDRETLADVIWAQVKLKQKAETEVIRRKKLIAWLRKIEREAEK